ncbi:uncharacterized protein [Lepeophtheirus salmonis]|uniref:uncharacterized protein n=1 Tax=Lepeophtheirus salmonis TaxID=72036 RepID=UPI001AE4D8F3|nr:uncharacterized protein LOC121119454 [Lepeophtheirus salmonis]
MRYNQVGIHLQDNTYPWYSKACSELVELCEKVASEIVEMEKLVSHFKVNCSDWASPIVSDLKLDGSVRVSHDFTQTISPVVKRMWHTLPHPDELFADLTQARSFPNWILQDVTS